MSLRLRNASHLEYLGLVTALLQRARRNDPGGGVWEAADLQWWWRRDQHVDPARQLFWLDEDGPAGAVILSDWGDHHACDAMSADHGRCDAVTTLWPVAREMIERCRDRRVEMVVREDDGGLIEAATAAGFVATEGVGVATSMAAAERPSIPALPAGFTLRARADETARPHHMADRNGPEVASRLRECSLHRVELDLAVIAPDGGVAAYGLFWPDPATGIGLVEPMRTEARYQGRGLARHVLAAGLDRLAAHGCASFKVTYMVGNEAARRLYLGAGFHPGATSRTYALEPRRRAAAR